MKKKLLCFTLVLALLLFTLAGCNSSAGKTDSADTPAKKTQHVVLNEVAHSIFYAPMYIAFEEGYFEEEGLDVELVTGFGADKTMTAVLSGDADIGFMGSEASIYTYLGGTDDPVVNFAQLTQRAGNFLVSREPIDNFSWDMVKGKNILGGRAGGRPYNDGKFSFLLPSDIFYFSSTFSAPASFLSCRFSPGILPERNSAAFAQAGPAIS